MKSYDYDFRIGVIKKIGKTNWKGLTFKERLEIMEEQVKLAESENVAAGPKVESDNTKNRSKKKKRRKKGLSPKSHSPMKEDSSSEGETMPKVPHISKKHKMSGNSPVSNKRIKKHNPDLIVKGSSTSATAKNDDNGSHFQTMEASTKKKSLNVQLSDPDTENTNSATIKLNLRRNAKQAHKRQSVQNQGNRRKIERSSSLTHNKMKHQKGSTIVLVDHTSVKTKISKRKDVEREPRTCSKRINVSKRRANEFEANKGEKYIKKRPITSSAINRWATRGIGNILKAFDANELKAFELKEISIQTEWAKADGTKNLALYPVRILL